MSNSASPIVAFGFDLGDESKLKSIDGFQHLIDATYSLNDKGWAVELFPHGHHEYRYWFLSIRGTRTGCGDWGSVVHFGAPPFSSKIEAAEAWCKEHNILWQTPQWAAVATYD